MMSDPDHRPDADTCRDCGRRGHERDGCNCIRDAFNDLVRTELATPPPMCECKCDGLEPHADRLCKARATTLVAMHRFGFCDEPADAGGVLNPDNVDEDGNLTAIMCDRCADHAMAVARRKVAGLIAGYTPGTTPTCPTCGRDVVRGEDIITRRHM